MAALNVVEKSVRFSGLFAIPATHSILMGYGAGDGTRTRDVQLGKLAFYH